MTYHQIISSILSLISWNCDHWFKVKAAKYDLHHTVTESALVLFYISDSSAERSEGVYASIPVFQSSQQSSEQFKVVYDYEAQVSFLAQMTNLYVRQLFWTLFIFMDMCWINCFCACLGGGWALCVLRRRRGCHRTRWGRLVDGAKEWPHWIGSRLLPYQRMSLPESWDCMTMTLSHFTFCKGLVILLFPYTFNSSVVHDDVTRIT